MAWVRVDDDWPTHPKVMGLSLAADGLWLKGLCNSNKHRTDGLIRGNAVAGMAGRTTKAQLKKIVQELVDAGLWVVEGENFRIHDYHNYQPSSSELSERNERISSARRSAGSSGGKRSAEVRRGKQNGSKTKPPIPVPIPEDPTTTPTHAYARACNKLREEGSNPPPTSPSPSLLAPPLPLTSSPVDVAIGEDFVLPPELSGVETSEEVYGPISKRGANLPPTAPIVSATKQPPWMTVAPPMEDNSVRADVIRAMASMDSYRDVERAYGQGYQTPLIEIFADHCVGTAGTIGCPMTRLVAVVEQVATELGGQGRLHGAPIKPDEWMTKLGKFVMGAKKWRDLPQPMASVGGPQGSGGEGKGGRERIPVAPRRSNGPKVQRDLSGSCTAEGAAKHYHDNAEELDRIGKELGF